MKKPIWYVDLLFDAPDPDNIPCKGQPGLFDLDIYEHGSEYLRVDPSFFGAINRELIAGARPALEACAGCPLANREWCLKVTAPEAKYAQFTGVAGGVLFRYGNPIADIDGVFDIERAA